MSQPIDPELIELLGDYTFEQLQAIRAAAISGTLTDEQAKVIDAMKLPDPKTWP